MDKTTASRTRRLDVAETLTKPLDRFGLICALANLSTEEAEGQAASPSMVLLGEGDALARRMEGAALRGGGYAVREAEDSRSCLDLAVSERPDAIVMDIDLPPVGAFDTIVELRRQSWATAIPLIVLTGRELTTEEENFLSGKVLQVVHKDLNMKQELVGLLNHLFANIQLQSSSAPEGDFGTWAADYSDSPPPT
jgi:DNA-binding response OmpR family regulator